MMKEAAQGNTDMAVQAEKFQKDSAHDAQG
jgi:hypothetical protein